MLTKEDKEKILFELGYVWGVCNMLPASAIETAFDSLELIKNIIDKY